MTGDLLWHNTLWFGAREDARAAGRTGEDAMDFTPTLAGVRPVVQAADLAICHNEVPVAKNGGPYAAYPAFNAPPQTLDAVKALGYDLCTTASNHSLDQGFDGLRTTLDQMDARGIRHAGTARTREEAETPTIATTKDGVRIAVMTGTYDTNGIPRPKGKEWSVPDLDPAGLLARAKRARQAGADIVLVAMHGGEEYQNAPNAQQLALAKVLTASPDVDLVYGHHVHVVQPITKVNGKWVVYGLGNLVAQHKTDVPMGYEGIITRFAFTERTPGRFEVTEAEFLPTLTTHYAAGHPARVGLVNEQLAAHRGDAGRLEEAKKRTRRIVTSLGGCEGLGER
ncbi:CapA family protein [Mariniluteicoccus flavus]